MAYWALKTRESKNNRQDMSEDHWKDFVENNVIAIGWEKLRISPDKASRNDLFNALKRKYKYSDKQAFIAADIVQKFVNLAKGDKVLICQGYTAKQNKNVYLYGTAKVTGPFINNITSNWWHYQHKAEIQRFRKTRREIPKKLLANKLSKGSLLLTLQKITKEGYESVVEWVRR